MKSSEDTRGQRLGWISFNVTLHSSRGRNRVWAFTEEGAVPGGQGAEPREFLYIQA